MSQPVHAIEPLEDAPEREELLRLAAASLDQIKADTLAAGGAWGVPPRPQSDL